MQQGIVQLALLMHSNMLHHSHPFITPSDLQIVYRVAALANPIVLCSNIESLTVRVLMMLSCTFLQPLMYSCYLHVLQVLKVHTSICFFLGVTEAIDPNTCAGCGGGYEDSTATEWAGCDMCERWWHWRCAGMKRMPSIRATWHCPKCSSAQQL